mgnify:CR=1 FL=1
MIVVMLVVSAYTLISAVAIRSLFRKCAGVKNPNLRLLAKSASLALFVTPTISVPATVPVPAILQLLVGVAVLHPELTLVGLIPITVVTLIFFFSIYVARLLKSSVYGASSA